MASTFEQGHLAQVSQDTGCHPCQGPKYMSKDVRSLEFEAPRQYDAVYFQHVFYPNRYLPSTPDLGVGRVIWSLPLDSIHYLE